MIKKLFFIFIALIFVDGIALVLVCFADPSPPQKINLLSDINNLDIKVDQWILSEGVLSKKSPLYYGDKFLVVKEDCIKVPVWYVLRCDVVNIQIQKPNDRFPEAGVVFGFVDEKNYWAL